MNRIKYRVWDIYKKKFVTDYVGIRPDGNIVIYNIWYDDYDEAVFQDESWTDIDDKNQFIIQQFTGLKDSAGKDIYEGDILKYEQDNGFASCLECKIGYATPMGRRYYGLYFATKNEKMVINPYDPPTLIHSYWNIIGNIFENPELLNE